MVLKALNDTEARIASIISTSKDDLKDLATKLKDAVANSNSPPADEAVNDD